MMTISAPENVIRALASSPQTMLRDILLNALGYDPKLKPVSPELRSSQEKALRAWFETEKSEQGEVPF